MSVFTQMYKSLNLRFHYVTKRNHKGVGVEHFHRFLNHSVTLSSYQRESHTYFVEDSMIATYTWNTMPIDGTYIIKIISVIGRPLRFPMDIVITALPTPINDTARTIVRYLQDISSDLQFSRDLIM